MKTQFTFIIMLALSMLLLNSCSIIRPGEVGMKQHLGKLKGEPFTEGSRMYNPFTTRIVKVSTRVRSHEALVHIQTKDGLEATAVVNLLYHVKPESVLKYYQQFGPNYNDGLVETTVAARVREGGVLYNATELIVQRGNLEDGIQAKLESELSKFGYQVDDFLLLDLELPEAVLKAISDKVRAEQQSLQTTIDIERKRKELEFEMNSQNRQTEQRIASQRMEADFSVEKQKKEAERTLIEAEALKQAQLLINESLTDKVLKFKTIEITKGLLASPNTKVVITDGENIGIHNDLNY